MKAFISLISAVAFCTPALLAGAEYYVAPNGNSSNDGSMSRPWDLYTGMSRPAPGDTVWLRGGTYSGTYDCLASGTASQPIKFRQYPGERARVDGGSSVYPAITFKCGNVWLMGFEIFFGDTRRVSTQTDSNPTDIYRGMTGATQQTTGLPVNIKLINMVVHDGFNNFGIWAEALNAEAYGNIIYYSGWDAPDRGHGHGIYSQNENNGTKRIEDNIMFRAFSHGLHVYGWGDYLNNYVIQGNIAFNNGELSQTSGYATNYRVNGDGSIPRNIVFKDNFGYFSPSKNGGNSVIGNDNGCSAITVTGNYFLNQNGTALLKPAGCTSVTMTGNTFLGRLEGFTSSQFPQNTYYASRPSGIQTFVRPNRYEPGRAHIVVLNWSGASVASVDVSSVLSIGDTYEVRDVQDYFGTPVLQGTWNGGSLNLPTVLTSVSSPVGNVPIRPAHTSSEFNVYVLQKTNGSTTTTQNKAPVVSAGANQTITLPASASLNGTVTDDGLPSGSKVTSSWAVASGPGTVTFANAASPVTTASFSTAGSYVLRLTASDSQLSASASVTITVNAATVNKAPVVSAGANQTITLPASASLNGTVTDDGLPTGSKVTSSWAVASGPGTVTFANAASPVTTASFSTAGSYVLRLTASDSQLSASASVTITVNTATVDQAPVVIVPGSLSVILPNSAVLSGSVTDDGLPKGSTVSSTWSVASGPGKVTFANGTSPSTTASFSKAGSYVLRLTATDGQLASSKTVSVTVTTSATNKAPVVSAGSNQTVVLPNSVTLNGSVSDDGLPTGSAVTVAWKAVSGPGTVTFGTPTRAVTTAQFTAAGVYVLRLTASDTQLSSSADVTITATTATSAKATSYLVASAAKLASPMALGANNGVTYLSTSSPESGTATFTYNAPVAGTYVMWGKVNAPSSSADSFYVSANGGAEDVYDTAEGVWSSSWQWTKVNGRAGLDPNTIPQRQFNLVAGPNTIVFRGREVAGVLSQIFITNDLTAVPTN